MNRIILHVDMDAFFAAIEQRNNPEYMGKPLIVGADPKDGKGRGVVSTCSYEARKFGVHSAMPISRAYKLCPHGIYVYPNGKLYSQVSREMFSVFYEFSDLVEPLSIDEAFIDVTGSIRLFGDGPSIGEKLKRRIYEKVNLTASVGIAPNKFLAKIASDLKKPDGLVVVKEGEIDSFLAPLDISRLWGAGEKTVQIFRKMGINTVGELAGFPKDILIKKFGKAGQHFYNLAHGIDNRPVYNATEAKSVSNENTFNDDVSDTEIIYKTLLWLSEKVAYRLRQSNLKGKTIHLKLRYDNFETISRDKTIPGYVSNTETLYKKIIELFDKNYQKGRKIRLVGVGVSGFDRQLGEQISLFDAGRSQKSRKLDELEDLLIDRFGKEVISRAESMKTKPPKSS
ncbi:MAG: DNA polymerase IV [Calditrichaceae bacterium]